MNLIWYFSGLMRDWLNCLSSFLSIMFLRYSLLSMLIAGSTLLLLLSLDESIVTMPLPSFVTDAFMWEGVFYKRSTSEDGYVHVG